MSAPEEAVIRRQRTWVSRLEYKVVGICDELLFCLGVAAPEHEHHWLLALVEKLYNVGGEILPAQTAVASCLVCADSEN